MSLSLPRVPVPGGAPSALPPRRQRLSRSAPSSPAARAASTQQHDQDQRQLFSGKSYPSRSTALPQQQPNNKQQQLIFESPRLEFDDHHLFPNAQHHPALRQHDTRWRYLQQVAGQHRQDATVLDLSNRCLTPAALTSGTPAAVARRVTELRLNVLGGGNDHCYQHSNSKEEASLVAELPLWLDAIDETFPALLHLSLQAPRRPDEHSDDDKHGTKAADYDSDGSSCSSKSEKSNSNNNRSVDKYAISNDEEEETTVSDHENSNNNNNNTNNSNDLTDAATVRRLYVLYRLPRLESLDGIPVQPSERRLALPRDRQQERQQAAAAATTNTALLDKAVTDEENGRSVHRGETAVEIDLNGQPHSSDDSDLPLSPTKRTATKNDPPPLHPLMDDDDDDNDDDDYMNRIEYESVESTQVCEWSAACGTLSLPYFRKPDRAKTKSRFHLKFRKPQQQQSSEFRKDNSSSSGAATATNAAHSNTTTTSTTTTTATATDFRSSRPTKNSLEKYQNHRKSLSVDPVMHVEDMSDHGEMIFEARPQRRRRSNGAATPPTVQTQLLESDDSVAARVPPAPLSKSLTALQSLQFDLKGRQSGGGGSPSRALGEQQQQQQQQQRRPPPSHSLTSPFPMQFRLRAQDAVVAKELTVSTDFDDVNDGGDDDERHREVSPPPAPRDTILDVETATTKLASRISLTRSRSSPTKLPSAWPTVNQQHTRNSSGVGVGSTRTAAALPPPCPESNARRLGSLTSRYYSSNNSMTRSSSSKASKSKRRASRWRAKIVARKSSIMDGVDDDDDDDDVDSSEEENLVTYANV